MERTSKDTQMILEAISELRKQLFDAIKELGTHPNAGQLHEHLEKKTNGSVCKTSVHNELKQMKEAGEIRHAGTLNGADHYCHELHEHHHFVCGDCKKVFDVDVFFDDEGTEEVSVLDGFEVKGHNLILSGLCEECNKDGTGMEVSIMLEKNIGKKGNGSGS